MVRYLKVLVWGFGVVGIVVGVWAGAPGPAAQGPVRRVEVDLRDPQSAYGSMIRSLMAEDAAQMKLCMYIPKGTDEEVVEALVDSQIAEHQAGRAVIGRFGEAGKRLLDSPMVFDDEMMKVFNKIKAVPAEVRGNQAVLRSSADPMGGGQVVLMYKADREWQMDTSRYLSIVSLRKDQYLGEYKGRTAWLREWAKAIQKGAYADADAAQAGLVLIEIAAGKGGGGGPKLPANRWSEKAGGANLTELQRVVYEQMAQLQECELLQMSSPGAPGLESPAPGTTEATVHLLKMGIDAVPLLAEGLGDTTPTQTSPRQRNPAAAKVVWTVNRVVAQLIRRNCEREFWVGEWPAVHTLDEVVEHPEMAPAFEKAVKGWYEAHRKETVAERKIADVGDGYFRNRLDAVMWLGKNKVAAAGTAVRGYVDRTVGALEKRVDTLTETELSVGVVGLGEIGDKGNLAQVEKGCKWFSAYWDERHKPMGSGEINDLFDAYHGMAMLGGKEGAIKE